MNANHIKKIYNVQLNKESEINELRRKIKALENSSMEQDRIVSQVEEKLFTALGILRQALMCLMCFEILVNSVTIACGHSFCERCWGDGPTICKINANDKFVLCTKFATRMKIFSVKVLQKLCTESKDVVEDGKANEYSSSATNRYVKYSSRVNQTVMCF